MEKLKEELAHRRDICSGVYERESDEYYHGKSVAYDEALCFVEALKNGDVK